jgi:uncharacterized repeat protein (TIGR02543 family)
VILLSVFAISAFFAETGETIGDPDLMVDTVSDLSDAMINASSDTGIGLTEDFADDLLQSGTVQAVINHSYNITISSSGALTAKTGTLHFNITNNGKGTVIFENIEFANTGSASTGGMQLQGGNWEFVNCTFKNLTKTAITFGGAPNHASFTDCTFSGNSSRALFLEGGVSGNIAEYEFKNCLFENNTVSGGGGGAIYTWTSYVSIDIDSCAFLGNKAIGTGTTHGSDNRVDGGALYINASYGQGCRLNIIDSYFENNFAQDDGGAIIVEGAKTYTGIQSHIINCTFTGNTAAGASYWSTATILGISATAGITNGSGGAVSYFGLTESSVTNCTFYNNGITNAYKGQGTNCGNIGGGGAIGVDTDDGITDPSLLPPCPVLSNNIFVGNYVNKNIHNTNTIAGVNISTKFNAIPTPYTGNVFVFTGADADRQNPLVIARPITNNGNIGYDNGNTAFDRGKSSNGGYGLTNYADDLGIDAESGLTVKNVFINVSGGVPIKEALGDPVGAEGNKGQRYYYMPSPTSDELYRDGSGPYFDSAFTSVDALGNPRDVFPNAGAIEIYWTKFNPGPEGAWSSVPTQINNPADITDPYFVVKSLNFASNKMYYVATDNGLPSPETVAMPRSALIPDNAQYGFAGWRSSQPDLGWWDQDWADANGVTETNLSDYLLTHTVSSLPADAFPLYQPGELVPSIKQVLTAEWRLNEYRVDFSLNYEDPPAHPTAEDNYWLPDLSDITQGGYDSAGSGIIAPPYVGVPYGDHVIQPKADPVRMGYVFNGWYKDSNFQTAWDFSSDIVEGDTVLYAQWDLETFTIHYDANGGDQTSCPADAEVVPNTYDLDDTTVPTHADDTDGTAIIFIGWTETADSKIYAKDDTAPTTIANVTIIDDDITVYAVWGYDTNDNGTPDVFEPLYTLSYDANGGDQTSCPADETGLLEGTHTLSSTVPVHEDAGGVPVLFVGWSLSTAADILSKGDAIPAIVTSVTITDSDVTVYAVWKYYVEVDPSAKTYFITASSDTGSMISPTGTVSVTGGTDMAFVFSAKDGYGISAVYVDDVAIPSEELASGKYTFHDVNSNHTIRVESKLGSSPTGGNDNGNAGNDGEDGKGDEWAVLNLICAVLTIFVGIIAVITGRDRRKKEDDDSTEKNSEIDEDDRKRSKTALLLRVLALIFGIVSVIIFFLTEDWTLPAVAVDEWTLLMFILFLASFIVTAVSFRFDEETEEQDPADKP